MAFMKGDKVFYVNKEQKIVPAIVENVRSNDVVDVYLSETLKIPVSELKLFRTINAANCAANYYSNLKVNQHA